MEPVKPDMEKNRGSIGRWQMVVFVLGLIILALVIGIIVLSVTKKESDEKAQVVADQGIPECSGKEDINLEQPDDPSVFHDLTAIEVAGLMKYLYSQTSLNLVQPEDIRTNNSYLYLAEIYIPAKSEVLDYLDNNGVKPEREAMVTIFRGDKRPPVVEEYLVGPLPNPNNLKEVPFRRHKIPLNLRPLTSPEYESQIYLIGEAIHTTLYDLVLESFGGKLRDCGDKCLTMKTPAQMSPAVSDVPNGRQVWYTMVRAIELYILYPLDFAVLIDFDHEKQNLTIDAVWYNGQSFSSLEELATGYSGGSVRKMKVPYTPGNDNTFSKMTRRGQAFQSEFKRVPLEVEPDGKRYSIHHNHVEYLGWTFDYRMSTVAGPQIYDIRFRNERIAYEISLQEIAVLYSGFKPSQMFVDFFDSYTLIGAQDNGLVPGVDCPAHATFMDTSFVLEYSKEPITTKNAFCIFEHNTGYPLRRHNAYGYDGFYEGMPNVVLTFRSIFAVENYDYIFDFIFFQNGVVQVRAMSTGYILATFHTDQEAPYGAQVHDDINGNLHTHLFNFKVDIDIKGKTNRFATWDIAPTTRPNDYSATPNAKYHMTNYSRNVKTTELEGAYKFNFDAPKCLLFYNEQDKNAYGNPKAYRVVNRGMVKQLFAEGEGNEPAASWARYQVAVTKYKESERSSSSAYAYMDSSDPVVQFQKFIDDDESIVDEDLVAWVTMGVHHIPHTEDLPVTPSPGMDLSFFLLPYNYFAEDPAMASKSSFRIDLKNGVKVTHYGSMNGKQCLTKKNDYFEMLLNHPNVVVDSRDGSTTK